MHSKIYKINPISQFIDIIDKNWQTKSCGIASLFMAMSWWYPKLEKNILSEMIEAGLNINAYIPNIGWSHKGLVNLLKQYGLDGENYDYFKKDNDFAFKEMLRCLQIGPIIISIYPKFDPNKSGGHLITIYGFKKTGNKFNFFIADPEAKAKGKILYTISQEKLKNGWKKRFIKIWMPK